MLALAPQILPFNERAYRAVATVRLGNKSGKSYVNYEKRIRAGKWFWGGHPHNIAHEPYFVGNNAKKRARRRLAAEKRYMEVRLAKNVSDFIKRN